MELTKWPRLLVVGDSVTEEQANEILVRTDQWYLTSNDKGWTGSIAFLVGGTGAMDKMYGGLTPQARQDLREELGALGLSYMYNSRIVSSFVGGPHGWCDWDGQIGCSTYNIGKWPSLEEVTEDWCKIAEAFPYLNLHSQLITDEGKGALSGRWHICEGRVVYEPDFNQWPICTIEELDEEGIIRRLTSDWGERGVEFHRLADAIRQVRNGRVGK